MELLPAIAISAPGTGTIGTLLFMILLEAVAQVLEDGKRKKADAVANGMSTRVYDPKTKSFLLTTWKDIRCGDVVKVYSYEVFPADLLCLCSSDGSECYVETKSLDGETNLKLRSAPKITYDAFRSLGRARGGGSVLSMSPLKIKSPRNGSISGGGMLQQQQQQQQQLSPNSPRRSKGGEIDRSISRCASQKLGAPAKSNNSPRMKSGNNYSPRRSPRSRPTSSSSTRSSQLSTSSSFIFHTDDDMLSHFATSYCDGQDPRDPLTSSAIDTFQGRIVLSKDLANIVGDHSAAIDGYPLSDKNICLRGCTLRNTDFIYGLVVNTGKKFLAYFGRYYFSLSQTFDTNFCF